jgi:hypothetical protein
VSLLQDKMPSGEVAASAFRTCLAKLVLFRLQVACQYVKARLEMVTAIATLLGALPSVFDTEDMRTTFVWLEKFVRNPWSHDDANTYGGEVAWPAHSYEPHRQLHQEQAQLHDIS